MGKKIPRNKGLLEGDLFIHFRVPEEGGMHRLLFWKTASERNRTGAPQTYAMMIYKESGSQHLTFWLHMEFVSSVLGGHT